MRIEFFERLLVFLYLIKLIKMISLFKTKASYIVYFEFYLATTLSKYYYYNKICVNTFPCFFYNNGNHFIFSLYYCRLHYNIWNYNVIVIL